MKPSLQIHQIPVEEFNKMQVRWLEYYQVVTDELGARHLKTQPNALPDSFFEKIGMARKGQCVLLIEDNTPLPKKPIYLVGKAYSHLSDYSELFVMTPAHSLIVSVNSNLFDEALTHVAEFIHENPVSIG